MTSLAVSHNGIISLLLDGMRLNLHITQHISSNAQILESQTGCVHIQNVVSSTQVHIAAGNIRLGTQLEEPGIHASEGGGGARQVSLGVGDLLEPLHNLGPLHDLGTGQLHGLTGVLLGVHAVGADGSGHIAGPHGLLQADTAVDVDQPGVDAELAADPT